MHLKPVLNVVGLAAYVIYENVFKEEINIACKEARRSFAVRSIWTFD